MPHHNDADMCSCRELNVMELQMKELQDQLEAENYFSVSWKPSYRNVSGAIPFSTVHWGGGQLNLFGG